jgi:hypothetical protein
MKQSHQSHNLIEVSMNCVDVLLAMKIVLSVHFKMVKKNVSCFTYQNDRFQVFHELHNIEQ